MRELNTNIFTIAPNLADIDVGDTYQILLSAGNTSLGDTFASTGITASEEQAAVEYRNSFKQGDTISALSAFYSDLYTQYINQICEIDDKIL